ncbi:MAG: isocitrate lyase/phosphoenolpyruvate mutase family protein, partial [Pseudomonadota bacterium]
SIEDTALPTAEAYPFDLALARIVAAVDAARAVGIVLTGRADGWLSRAYDQAEAVRRCQAFADAGADVIYAPLVDAEERARDMGIGVYKVAMPWPLETDGLTRFARGKARLVVVEHKRAFLEPQIKDALYGLREGERPQIFGKTRPDGQPFLSDVLELRQHDLVQTLLQVIPGAGEDEAMRAVAIRLAERADWAAGRAEGAQRTAYFCAGCPHSTSTKVPESARAMPGIGCHAMTEINGNTTDGQIAMGGEGVPWVGQQPFSRDTHVFVNMGDGTYYHSGILAIRQAVAANVPITYKILYNDAVAMTGGQAHDGPLSVGDITRQLKAEGVEKVVVLAEAPENYAAGFIAPGVPVHHRDGLPAVQAGLAAFPGVSALVFDQTCAAEKRRRRKKGILANPPRRLFINKRVCEGCGDCSVQSNCIAVEPRATEFGEKREINQSTCNKDFSCVKGFCPAFAYVDGAEPKKEAGVHLDIETLGAELPDPSRLPLAATHNVLITGIGGFGVTTTAAVLAIAGHIEGITASTLDMTGLAQKNGPVTSHVRYAPKGHAIEGPRVPAGALDTLIAADMLVACNAESLSMLSPQRTLAVVNTKVQPTAEFVMKRTQSFDDMRMTATLREGANAVEAVDAALMAEKLFGDQIF